MHDEIGTPDGKVHHVECDPFEIEEKIDALVGVILTPAETLELYQRQRERDRTGQMEWGY